MKPKMKRSFQTMTSIFYYSLLFFAPRPQRVENWALLTWNFLLKQYRFSIFIVINLLVVERVTSAFDTVFGTFVDKISSANDEI
jgi:hypothetical protein